MKASKQHFKQFIASLFFLILCGLLIAYKMEKSDLAIMYLFAFVLFIAALYNLYAIINPDNYFLRRQKLLYEPEKHYVITITDEEIAVSHTKDESVKKVRWDDLQLVEIVTTDEGPFRPDLFYVLHGSSSGCTVPLGAVNFDALFERLQQLPGFDNTGVILASSCALNDRFEVWRRQEKNKIRKRSDERKK